MEEFCDPGFSCRITQASVAMEDRQENLVPSSFPNQRPLSIDEELWHMAEERAQEILCTIQPNVVSELNRKEVIDYVQGLIRGHYGAEVFVFGSAPLKTYLPDGDVDLTVLSHESTEEDLAKAVRSILENRDDFKYQVKDIQYIPAQVQVVKCTVKNIAVDISFNQMAGLYALRFLEQVDQVVGKKHLFKRSIILVKAWCYYESRILGAHHGLLSTYAVETLVLYIINRFHSSVRGPLEVLYRFLDYYSKFNWDCHYVSIDGPKALSSLPEIVGTETPDGEQGEFLLCKEFVLNYRDICSVPPRTSGSTTNEFPTKFMNIMDPLRSDNNLGRSVSRGNLHRIKFALGFGARSLRDVLTLPGESMGAALEKFFMNTLDRNGKGQRPDVEVPVPAFGTGRSEEPVLRGDCESYYGALQYTQLYRNYAVPHISLPSSPSSASQADIHALSTQKNWSMIYTLGTDFHMGTALPSTPSSASLADIHGLSTQQNWSVIRIPPQTDAYLQAQPDVYVPTQADFCVHTQAELCVHTQGDFVYLPTHTIYSPHAPSRGTGTYIPDVTRNSYWDMRVSVSRARKPHHVNHNALPKSPQRKQQLVEVHSEPDMNGSNSNSFELTNEEFPLLPAIPKTSLAEAKEEFPLLPSMRKAGPAEAKEEFPLLPGMRKAGPAEAKEEFPLLPSIRKTSPAEAKESAPLTGMSKQARNSSPFQLNIEFGSYGKKQSPAELCLPTKNEKEDFGVSSSQGTAQVVPSVAMERKDDFL